MPAANTNRWKVLHRFGPPMLITLGVLWLLQGALARTSNHGVIIHNLNFDAGTVKAGTTVTDTVRIINLSSSPVEVDAQPSCGCTVAEVQDKPLVPLHSELVRLDVDTDGLKKGQQQKYVLLKMHSGTKSWEQVASIRFRAD